jgi:hypothetical protein
VGVFNAEALFHLRQFGDEHTELAYAYGVIGILVDQRGGNVTIPVAEFERAEEQGWTVVAWRDPLSLAICFKVEKPTAEAADDEIVDAELVDEQPRQITAGD